MSGANIGVGVGTRKKCPCCKKHFIVWHMPDWTYKNKNKHKYYCSYTCWTKGEKL